jgi:hypothetical protein
MGAFNTVLATVVCPRCHSRVQIPIQFKYGDTWQHEYAVGDPLRRGGNDIGSPGARSVVVAGVAGSSCPKCAYEEPWDFYVYIENNVISGVEPADGRHNFVAAHEGYLVLRQ